MTTSLSSRRREVRTAIVTGAAGGFGAETCARLRASGVDVVGLDVRPAPGVLACDVTDTASVEQAVGTALASLGGRVDLLIHLAGIGSPVDVGTMPGAEVMRTFEVNLFGAWRVTAAALPGLLEARGRVVCVASLLAGLTIPLGAPYTVSKRGLTAYADTLRAEYGTHLTVTTVYPGYVDTPIHDASRQAGIALDGSVPEESVDDVVSTILRVSFSTKPSRDVATSRLGSVALWTTRHLPGTLERGVTRRISAMARKGQFSTAPVSRGLHLRQTAPDAALTSPLKEHAS